MKWQRRARLIIAVLAVAFAVVVAFAYKRRPPAPAAAAVPRLDPSAVLESTGGRVERFRLSREDVRVEYEKQLTYADGSNRMMGVRVVTDDRNGRSYTVTGKEGKVGQNESTIQLDGDVRLVASDGMAARTEHAVYNSSDGVMSAPGPVEFANGRMTATGVGMTWDKNRDVLWILDKAVVHVAKDDKGGPPTDITSGRAGFARRDRYMRFENEMRMERGGQVIEATNATTHLSPDEKRIETVELRENSRMTAPRGGVGALRSLTGRDIDLTYREDGETLERALVTGGAVIQLAGAGNGPGRQIAAGTITISLAPDGSTPTALTGRDNVQLTLPAEGTAPARTIRSASLDATGEPGRGLTHAKFTGSAQYRERGPSVDRSATAAALDVAMKPGMSAIEEARFSRGVRFVDGKMTATSAAARYDLDKGILELTGSEPTAAAPHVVNDQIAVDGTRIDVTLAGPKMKATGNVKSVLQPAARDAGGQSATKRPSMLKQDEPVNITAASLDFDGAASKAGYTGGAQLWQGDTSVKADTIAIDDKSGDLSATGSVTTTTMLKDVDNETKQRVRSIGTAQAFKYEDGMHRTTYTGDAHVSGSEGDLTAPKIELYLKPSGDQLDRMEGYESVTFRNESRRIKGVRLTYTADDQRYVVTGAPVTIADECNRESKGQTLTYDKAADTIVVDGNQQIRTETKGGGKCQ